MCGGKSILIFLDLLQSGRVVDVSQMCSVQSNQCITVLEILKNHISKLSDLIKGLRDLIEEAV